MSPPAFIRATQAFVARASLGASTVRGRGNKGAAAAARRVLAPLDLAGFATSDAKRFRAQLDAVTEAVRRSRRPFLTWGLARKCVNIFLRDAFYNRYLCRHYGLRRAERLLEVPVDSLVGKDLRERFGADVPKWASIATLTPEQNNEYQKAAMVAARDELLKARIHLDAFVWGRPD
jgi:hypothetical protein